jgi:bifunctional UDP-N-acetylglucosamine pyrophosphorylase / glucosamine-1-phosphate N-acetyltransferase
MNLSVIILAAGQGTRMKSQHPKILHKVAGKSMLERVVNTSSTLDPTAIHVVYGHQGEEVRSELSHLDVNWIEQTERLGTGHAVQQVNSHLADDEKVLILYGDVPLISKETLEDFIKSTPEDGVGVITAVFDHPGQLGRIIRDHSGNFVGIVEFKDANNYERQIREVNSGIYVIPAKYLKEWLPLLSNDNAQQEYYLTDALAMAVKRGISVVTVIPLDNEEVLGVNDRVQLSEMERYFQDMKVQELMLAGVTVLDPARVDIRGDIMTGHDVTLDVNVILEGSVTIGNNTSIGANCIIRNSIIGPDVTIEPNSIIEDSEVAQGCSVGPFARLRPQSKLAENAKVGNFVEVKKSTIGKNSKVGHLSYIGDAQVGDDVNVGAGSITCNYDGINKHRTVIGKGSFIGSGSQLVAPVTVGEQAFIGAGSTITKDTPDGELTLSRAKQTTLQGWKRPVKKEEDSCVE